MQLILLWIFFSDIAVESIFVYKDEITFAQNIKGWFFVAFTGILIFLIARRDFDLLSKTNKELINSYDQTIQGWIRVMDLRHQETKDHTERVTNMTLKLAKLSEIANESELRNIEHGAMLHPSKWTTERLPRRPVESTVR